MKNYPKEQKGFKWDRHAIKAAIHRKGTTLSEIARRSDLNERGISVVFNAPFPAAEKAISNFLQVPLHVLWPSRYDAPNFENSKTSNAKSQSLSPEDDEDGNAILVSREEAA